MPRDADEHPPMDHPAGAGPSSTASTHRPVVPTVPSGRRDHLDGIRTLAVYLVVAFHSGIARYGGGHIGVDVFFVLSGYLVTGVLLRDLAAPDTGGRVRFGRFYARRARRLLPAAILCLLGTAVAYAAIAGTAELAEARDGFRAAAIYLTNWHLIDASTGYFATDVSHSPILHFWSLAVEEQFYLVWPLLFSGVVAVAAVAGRHRWTLVRVAVALVAAASALWQFSIRGSRPDHAYYGTDVRAYQLLAGALLALCPVVIVRARKLGRLNELAGVVGILGLVAVSVMPSRMDFVARGYVATACTLVILVALESGAARRLASAVGARPIAYLGAISYGTYLWHWPVIVLASTAADLRPAELGILSAVVGTGLAALSYQLVEHPARSARIARRWSWPIAIGGLATSVLVGLVALPWITRPQIRGGGSTAATAELTGYRPVPAEFDFDEVKAAGYGAVSPCSTTSIDRCTQVEGSGPHLVLYGDSNAQMWVPAFTVIAEEHGFRFSVVGQSGCRWQDGLFATSGVIPDDVCRREHRFVYDEALDQLDPDLLIVTNTFEIQPPSMERPDGPRSEVIEETTTASLTELDRRGIDVLVIESKPLPIGRHDPLACLADATVVEECRFPVPESPNWIDLHERKLAEDLTHVSTIDLDALTCPLAPVCDPYVDGRLVWWDGLHINAAYSEHLAPKVYDLLVQSGSLPST